MKILVEQKNNVHITILVIIKITNQIPFCSHSEGSISFPHEPLWAPLFVTDFLPSNIVDPSEMLAGNSVVCGERECSKESKRNIELGEAVRL